MHMETDGSEVTTALGPFATAPQGRNDVPISKRDNRLPPRHAVFRNQQLSPSSPIAVSFPLR